MRALRVLGLAEDGEHLVCEEPTSGEQFALPADDKLRAAARGDLSRFGQLEIEMQPQLRPREIQARIRAGATVEQVATAAGCTPERIERYAYPVLLERSTVTARARTARPVSGGVAGSRSVEEIVSDTLTQRGQGQAVSWDAFRDNDVWVLSLRWKAGRSENRAHWAFHPGAAGGTLTPRDDAAAEIVDPAPRPLRTIRSAAEDAAGTTRPTDSRSPAEAGPHERIGSPSAAADAGNTPSLAHPAGRASMSAPASSLPGAPRVDINAPISPDDERLVEDTVTDPRSGVMPAPARAEIVRTGTEHARTGNAAAEHAGTRGAKRGQRPAMPSWEDVLLGTRSAGH